jgi:hypothetical protein
MERLRIVGPMQFSPELRDRVASGRISLSFRLWSRPKVKIGGQYASGAVRIEIDAIEIVPFSSVTAADVRRAGEKDRESLRQRAAHAGPIMTTTRSSIASSFTSFAKSRSTRWLSAPPSRSVLAETKLMRRPQRIPPPRGRPTCRPG